MLEFDVQPEMGFDPSENSIISLKNFYWAARQTTVASCFCYSKAKARGDQRYFEPAAGVGLRSRWRWWRAHVELAAGGGICNEVVTKFLRWNSCFAAIQKNVDRKLPLFLEGAQDDQDDHCLGVDF